MVRGVTEADGPAVVELAVSSGLFSVEETEGVAALMVEFFDRTRAQGHVCLLDHDAAGKAVAVAYYQPRAATDRTWELLMIAVRRDQQGCGRGSALLTQVEADLRGREQRLLLVETSGVPDFARTRAFYDTCGYTAEARVRDYYAIGDDMVLYRKDLTAASGPTDPGLDDTTGHVRARPSETTQTSS